MSDNSQNDWIAVTRIIRSIEVQAGLRDINWSMTYNSTVSRKNLDRQEKLLSAVAGNKAALEMWVGRQERLSDEKKAICRSIYRQYAEAQARIIANTANISAYLAEIEQGGLGF